ncbi:MAG: radical SAM protein [Planctomycetota bacterium]|nr:radical SAM protein [Planctomycetota bacterium]
MPDTVPLDAVRSPVPDLLFEDQREARIDEIRDLLEAPERLDARTPLHRLTVFLTYRCNLACPYCKTIARSLAELRARPEKGLTYTLDDFRRLLDGYAGTPIRHLHFTGGEASLVRELPAMVRLARARGVEAVSLTTNGTLPPARYLELIAAGLNELRVSIDAADAALGRKLTERDGAFEATLATIRGLAQARRESAGARFFLILNTVVSRDNAPRLPEILRFLLALGPDDLKLIADVDARGRLAEPEEARKLTEALAELVAALPAGGFPLLRRKLRTVFAAHAIGLEDVPAPARGGWRCYVPLTERTVDGRYYYPCSVYLREGGAPLGRLDDPPGVQRAKSAAFARRGDCLSDPVCRRYCLHCTKNYNVRCNEERL